MSSCDPIGVFDSGFGGLTIVKALRQVLPNEPLIYYGDLAHLPYGDKSPELVRGFSLDITDFLLQKPVKAVVIACNTASAAAGEAVRPLASRAQLSLPNWYVSKMSIPKASQSPT